MPLAWRIYYDDGSTFDDSTHELSETPATGFICALGYDESDTRYIMHGWDFYRFDQASRQWWGMTWDGILDRLEQRKEIYAFMRGRTVTKTEWQRFMTLAHEDPDFPFGVKGADR